MLIQNLSLPLLNRLADDYVREKPEAMQFFQYTPHQLQSYRERLKYLKERTYTHRNRLADGLAEYNRQIGNHQAALEQIVKLRSEHTYVVIAGQQAGVLTGPMYTILKAVQLVQEAKKLQAELNVSVVPVFWIAGEDHDLEEINHLFVAVDQETKVTKIKMGMNHHKAKMSASQVILEEEACRRLLDDFFREHTETTNTPSLRELLEGTARESSTVVDWFARIMARLFGKHGLVFVESSSPYIRELEQPVFRRLIEENEQVAVLLESTSERIKQSGYPLQLQLERNQANLFLYEGPDRLLLERDGERFMTKDGRFSYSREQLLALLESDPQRFSTNVVSRPLMQEHLFPTLSFIGGPGEVAYWAFYKSFFAHFDYQLPIVTPRLSVTIVEAAIERLMNQLELDLETVFTGFAAWKENRLEQMGVNRFSERFKMTRQAILATYQPLVDDVVESHRGLQELASKNVDRILAQVDFLQEQVQRSELKKHEVELRRIERVETMLLPGGGWQERIFSFFSFANKHGLDLLDRLVEAPFSGDSSHKIVTL